MGGRSRPAGIERDHVCGRNTRSGWFVSPGDGFVPGAETAAAQLIARGGAHTHLGHVRSSQRFALNLFGALGRPGVARLLAGWFGPMESVHLPEFEWTDPDDRLSESTSGRPHQTQVDVMLAGTTKQGARVAALVEVKLTETSFGGCSHADIAPIEARGVCVADGPFGGAPAECWQLRNRDVGNRRRYDEHLELAQTNQITSGGLVQIAQPADEARGARQGTRGWRGVRPHRRRPHSAGRSPIDTALCHVSTTQRSPNPQ